MPLAMDGFCAIIICGEIITVIYPLNGHGLKLNHITPAARKYSAQPFEYCENYF